MTTPTEAVKQAIEVLNRVHAADPTVLPALLAFRVPCNLAVADDPTVQVRKIETRTVLYEMGLCRYCGLDIAHVDDVWRLPDGIDGHHAEECPAAPDNRHQPEDAWEVGLLGIINGFFGVQGAKDVGYIVANFDSNHNLVGFSYNEL